LLCKLCNLKISFVSMKLVRGNSYQSDDKTMERESDIPFRLLDCLGFVMPVSFFAEGLDAFEVDCFRFLGGGAGLGAGVMTGEERKADGEGIVIVSILKNSSGGTWMEWGQGERKVQ
jgi:hypothetical protein